MGSSLMRVLLGSPVHLLVRFSRTVMRRIRTAVMAVMQRLTLAMGLNMDLRLWLLLRVSWLRFGFKAYPIDKAGQLEVGIY